MADTVSHTPMFHLDFFGVSKITTNIIVGMRMRINHKGVAWMEEQTIRQFVDAGRCSTLSVQVVSLMEQSPEAKVSVDVSVLLDVKWIHGPPIRRFYYSFW
jgi:hypothetical protein